MQHQPLIAEFEKNQPFEGFLLVRMAEIKTSASGSKYFDALLADKSGEISAKMWDTQALPYATETVAKVRGVIQEYNGRLQMRIDKTRACGAEDEVDYALLIPTSPEDPAELLDEALAAMESIADEELRQLTRRLLDNAGAQLGEAAAAVSNHHAIRGGLIYHTVSMLRAAEAILPLYPFLSRDLLIAGVLAHDIAKTKEMDITSCGLASGYTPQGDLLGHIAIGVNAVYEAARDAGCCDEKRMLLAHMILSHHYEPEFGSPKKPMIPEAEMLHFLDVMDARMWDMRRAAEAAKPGAFSERVRSLEFRKIYKPMYSSQDNTQENDD